ncbi:MAG: hypothetical protein JWR80_6707 [Bradyrhizobium sp.]|nr:hypothetical protein [Bradyrhizobium sp.]
MLETQDHSITGPARVSPRLGKMIIAAFAVAIIGASWLMLCEQVSFECNQAIAAAVVQNENRAAAFQQYTQRTLEVASVAIDHVANDYAPPALTAGAAPVARIRDDVVANRMFAAVYVLDADGQVVATTLADGGGAEKALDRAAFPQGVARTEHLSISRPMSSRALHGDFILLTRWFTARPAAAEGRVVILVRPTEFTKMAQGAAFSCTDMISLIGLDGITRSRRTGNIISWGENLSGKLVMRRQFAEPNGRYVGPGGLDGIRRFFSHRRLPRYRLFVTSGLAVDVAMAPVRARERSYIIGGALITVAVAAGAWMLIAGLARRERQLAALAAVNRRLLEAQRVGAMGDWDFDPATDQLRWSPHLYDMYERDPRDAVSAIGDVRSYASAEDAEALREGIRRVVATGERQEHILTVTLPSGTESTRHIVAVPTLGPDGTIVGIHGTDHDVTAQRKLREAEAKLAHFSRIDAMNAMASTLAHELNHPLAIATNYLTACKRLLQRTANPPKARLITAIDSAGAQVRNAGEIIRGVRAIVSGGGGAKHFASLRVICQDAVSILRSATPARDFTIRYAITPDSDMILCVAVQIQQILTNLMLNSVDAQSGTAGIEIVVGSERVSPTFVAITVSDNGHGMPFEARELFSALVTTKPAGLGLGLSICRTLVEAHGGEIALKETGPSGTTIGFTLESPRSTSEAVQQLLV